MKAALRNESLIAGLVLVDPFLPDHVVRVFAGDCPCAGNERVEDNQPTFTSPSPSRQDVAIGSDRADMHTSNSSLKSPNLSVPQDTKSFFVAAGFNADRAFPSNTSGIPPLYVSSLSSATLGLPTSCISPIGIARLEETITHVFDPSTLDGAVYLARALFSPSIMVYGDWDDDLRLPLYANDFVLAQYMRSQTVGAALGPYGAVPPHAIIQQDVGGDVEPGESPAFSDRFMGWVPCLTPDERQLRVMHAWSVSPLLASSRSPWFNLEGCLATARAVTPVDPASAVCDSASAEINGVCGQKIDAAIASMVSRYIIESQLQSTVTLMCKSRTIDTAIALDLDHGAVVILNEEIAKFNVAAAAGVFPGRTGPFDHTSSRKEYVFQQVRYRLRIRAHKEPSHMHT
jgi:hypothetical protein